MALAVLFAITVAHKSRVLVRGEAADEPLLRRHPVLARHAPLILAVVVTLEVAVTALLVTRPTWGFVVAAAVVAGYTTQVRGLAPDQSCHCFGDVLDAESRDSALLRNAVIIAGCVVAAAVSLLGVVSETAVTPAVLGGTLVLLSLPLARAALRRESAAATVSSPDRVRSSR